jgi:hypothetical protein
MADPTVTAIAKDTWTLVATNVTTGRVHPLIVGPRYFHTYRDTGGTAPTGLSEAVEFTGGELAIEPSVAADVYVICTVETGSVRVDT